MVLLLRACTLLQSQQPQPLQQGHPTAPATSTETSTARRQTIHAQGVASHVASEDSPGHLQLQQARLVLLLTRAAAVLLAGAPRGHQPIASSAQSSARARSGTPPGTGVSGSRHHGRVSVVGAWLAGATAWNYITWNIGMPSSSSHAIIGGLVGAGIAVGGLAAVDFGSVSKAAIGIRPASSAC